jgi:GNAT superfamily N-acetyltransferase
MPLMTSTLEEMELVAWEDAYCAASPAVRAAGIRHTLVQGVLVTTAPKHDILALNRALGPAMSGEAVAETLDRVLDTFRQHGGAHCMIAVPPSAAGLGDLLAARGFYHHNSWVKLVRDAPPPPSTATDLSVRQLGTEDAQAFGELIQRAFDWPEVAAGLFGATVDRDGWIHYGSFDDDRLVAGGGMFVRDDSAWLGPAATYPEARRRGAQSTLLGARLNAGIACGVNTFVVETAEPTAEKPVASLRNLHRFGFEVAYVRANWVAPTDAFR